MALINEKKEYIRLDKNGQFEFYKSEQDRLKLKNAPSSEIILKKYNELLKLHYELMYNKVTSLGITENDYEQGWEHYYSLVSQNEECKDIVDYYFALNNEQADYMNDLAQLKGAKHKFTLMNQYFNNVEDSIPNYICLGFVGPLKRKTVEEEYNYAKQQKMFGDTIDC